MAGGPRNPQGQPYGKVAALIASIVDQANRGAGECVLAAVAAAAERGASIPIRHRMMGPEPQAPVSVTLRAVQWDRILDLILVAYDDAPDALRGGVRTVGGTGAGYFITPPLPHTERFALPRLHP